MVVAQEKYDYYSLPEEKKRAKKYPKRNWLPREKKTLIGLVMLTFCVGMLIAYYYSMVVISGYNIYSLNCELDKLRQETVIIAGDIDKLNSLERIEYVATTKLNMVKPDRNDIVMVTADLNAPGSVENDAGDDGEKTGDAQGMREIGKSKMVQAFAYLMGKKGS